MKTLLELQMLYDELGDGIAWNPLNKIATFQSRASAQAFFIHARTWTVQYVVTLV